MKALNPYTLTRRVLPLRSRRLIQRQLINWRLRLKMDSSQHGEYFLLKNLIKSDFPRYVVDIGAYDGVTMSNSYPFIRQGWGGIMVEPHPVAFGFLSELYNGNNRVRCINKAVSNKSGSLPFFLGGESDLPMTSTLCNDDNELMRSRRSGSQINVSVDRLTNILQINQAPQDFSILMIDTEGMDYEVLCGLDFNQFQPRILVTEEYILNTEKHNQKHRLLQDNGYALYTMAGANTIWIRNAWVKRAVYDIKE